MGGISTIGAAVANEAYTPERGENLDHLNADVSSRLSSVRVQRGTANTFGGSSTGRDTIYEDVTITAVDPTKSLVILHGYSAGFPAGALPRLTSSTNLRISFPGSVTSPTVDWQVIEIS